MPATVFYLRRWFATGAILVALAVAGAYVYARWRFSLAKVFIPGKMNLQIQQSAREFTISKSEEGRTLFTIRASKAVQYTSGAHAELQDVTITIFGRDSARFDQIYGKQFDYDPATGTVIAHGEVQIDLQANPQGVAQPDQSIPKELKNPVHLVTSGLVFNQKTGDAYTPEKVEFSVPQANGSALGAKYTGKTGVLELASHVDLTLTGTTPTRLNAVSGVIAKLPRQIDLQAPHLVHGPELLDAHHGTVFLRSNNTVDRALAAGNVHIQVHGRSQLDARSEKAEIFLNSDHATLAKAVLSENVRVDSSGQQSANGTAGRLILNFTGQNLLASARAEDNVKLIRHRTPTSSGGNEPADQTSAQDVQITAPAIDFVVAQGRSLKSATSSGAAQIEFLPADPSIGQKTVITAAKFDARFDDSNHLRNVHAAPDAKITNTVPGQPDRISTSESLDASFLPDGGIEDLAQDGNVSYRDGQRQAWGEHARYTPSDQVLSLTGSPRVVESGVSTTATRIRINRSTGEAFAEDNVKTTYSELKPQPGGALLATSSPIHVIARRMSSHKDPGVATYTGNARLWQDANVVEAPTIEFDRDHRRIVAHGSPSETISTVLMQADTTGKQTPVLVTSQTLTYTDEERRAHYEGNVVVKSNDATMTADKTDVFLQPRSTSGTSTAQPALRASRVEKIISEGHVVLVQPKRRAEGDRLVYTAQEDKYVLTGAPGRAPSIFDAEHGNVSGDSLTFYKRDDRVVVEGDAKSPTVTQTRVAR
jgi:lipopolysaccharide export system protein LptA